MNLRSQAYGFFDPSTLFVFVDPFSPDQRVRDALLRGGPTHWAYAKRLLPELPPSSRQDLVFRISAHFHERQHFHDVLMTPYGNQLVQAYFILAARAVALVQRLCERHEGSGKRLRLPLSPEEAGDPHLLSRAHEAYRSYIAMLEGGRFAFEASASIAHRLAVRDALGSPASEILAEGWSGSPLYDALPSFLDETLTEILDLGHEVGIRQMRQVILMALSTESPDETLVTYARQLGEIASGLKAGRTLRAPFDALLDEGREPMRIILQAQREANLKFLLYELAEEMETLRIPVSVQTLLNDAFTSFMTVSADARQLLIDHPEIATDGWGLLNAPEGFCEPHVYWFVQPANEHAALLVEQFSVDPEELYAFKEYHTPDGTKRVVQLVPGPSPEVGRFLSKPAWIEIAKGPAGAIALLESPNFLHPLKGWWLRTTGTMWGVTFERGPRLSRPPSPPSS